MSIAQDIADILKKRREQADHVTSVIERLERLEEKLKKLDEHKEKFNDNSYLASRSEKIDFIRLIAQISQQIDELNILKTRLSRSTLNIGVVGGMRQGKSLLLQTLTGLTDDEIPTGDGGICTRVLSKIFHSNSQPEKIEVKFHSYESLKQIIHFYFDKLDLPNPKPDIPKDLANGKRPPGLPEHLRDTEARYQYGTLGKLYYAKYQEYKSFINKESEIIDRKDIKKYISDDDEKNSKYLAVKELEIRCKFHNPEVGDIGVIDLPGFGDTLLDTELLIKTLKQDIDFILFVRKPNPDGDGWKKSDREIYEIACRALEGFPIRECSFMVLNYRKSKEEDNLKTCKHLKATIDSQEIKVSETVIADCSKVKEVEEHILKPVLENLTRNIHFVSEKYLESQDEVLVNLHNEIKDQLEKAIHLLDNYIEPGERGFSYWFKAQFWNPLNEKMLERQQALLNQQTEPDDEFRIKVNEVVESCKRDDEKNPLSKQIIGFSSRHKSYKVAYYLCVNELRNEFVEKMNFLAQALIKSERDLQLSVVEILSNDGNLKELTEDKGIEFLAQIEKKLPPNTYQLRKAFQEIKKSSDASGDIIQGWIKAPLAQLLPDQQIDPFSEEYYDTRSKQSNQHQTLASNNQHDENSQLENSTNTPIDTSAIGSEEELNQTLASNNQHDENSQLESSNDTPVDAPTIGLKEELIQKIQKIQNKIDFLRNKVVEECKKELETKLNYPNEQAFTKFDTFMTSAFTGDNIETEWQEFCDKPEIKEKLWHGAKQKKQNQKVEEDWKTLVDDAITANKKDVLRLLKKQT